MTLIDAAIDDRVQLGLTILALCRGNSVTASSQLQELGHEIADSTLRVWRTRDHVDLYEQIRSKRAPEVERTVINDARDLALEYAELERLAIQKTTQALEQGTLKDPSAAFKNASIAKGVNVDKMLVLDGRPDTIVDHRRTRDVLFAELERDGLIEGTAQDITDAAFPTEGNESNPRVLQAGDPPR